MCVCIEGCKLGYNVEGEQILLNWDWGSVGQRPSRRKNTCWVTQCPLAAEEGSMANLALVLSLEVEFKCRDIAAGGLWRHQGLTKGCCPPVNHTAGSGAHASLKCPFHLSWSSRVNLRTELQLHRIQVTFLKTPDAFRPIKPRKTGGPLEWFCQDPRKAQIHILRSPWDRLIPARADKSWAW